MLQSVWGNNAVDLTPHINDRLRLYGIIMTREDFIRMLQRLCDGDVDRACLDDPH